jgi:hypothetical protein
MVLLVTVSVPPLLEIAPPLPVALPFLMERLFITTVIPEFTTNARTLLLPLIFIFEANVEPSMIKFLSMTIWELSVIVCPASDWSNVIPFPAEELMIVCRKEPDPLSFVFVTTSAGIAV